MLIVEENVAIAIAELQCVQTGSPATLSELNALRVARDRVEALMHDCVHELRDHATAPVPWDEITKTLDDGSTNAVRKRFTASLARELEQVDRFWSEYSERFAWTFLPNGFVYDLYRGWLHGAAPGSTALSQETFSRQLLETVRESGGWVHARVRTGALLRSLRIASEWEHEDCVAFQVFDSRV